MKFIINTKNDATKAYCVSLENTKTINLPNLHFGDVVHFELEIGDGFGDYAEFYGRADVAVSVGIGEPETRNLYASAQFDYSNAEYHCDLNLDTTSLADEINGKASINCYMEIKLGVYGGDTHTLLQMPIRIQNQLIS